MTFYQFEGLLDEAADLDALAAIVEEYRSEEAERLREEACELRLEAAEFVEEMA